MELFARLRRQQPQVQVIVLTGFGDLESAQQAVHLDVVEFLTKPCALGDLEIALDRARARLSRPVVERAQPAPPPPPRRADPDESNALEAVERRHILAVLEKNHGNRAATAAELGISLRKLYYRLGQYQREGWLG
jgi:DNA-binding NtrC family response regulator